MSTLFVTLPFVLSGIEPVVAAKLLGVTFCYDLKLPLDHRYKDDINLFTSIASSTQLTVKVLPMKH